jgi:hypothetical protein
MQILAGNSHVNNGTRLSQNYKAAPKTEGQADSVTLGYNDAKDVGLMTGAGFLPGVGAVANFMAMVGAGVNNKETLSWMNLAGAGANVAGTAAAATGLLIGNSTATYVGLALLGVSGITAGVTTAAL